MIRDETCRGGRAQEKPHCRWGRRVAHACLAVRLVFLFASTILLSCAPQCLVNAATVLIHTVRRGPYVTHLQLVRLHVGPAPTRLLARLFHPLERVRPLFFRGVLHRLRNGARLVRCRWRKGDAGFPIVSDNAGKVVEDVLLLGIFFQRVAHLTKLMHGRLRALEIADGQFYGVSLADVLGNLLAAPADEVCIDRIAKGMINQLLRFSHVLAGVGGVAVPAAGVLHLLLLLLRYHSSICCRDAGEPTHEVHLTLDELPHPWLFPADTAVGEVVAAGAHLNKIHVAQLRLLQCILDVHWAQVHALLDTSVGVLDVGDLHFGVQDECVHRMLIQVAADFRKRL
ncbi:hypothetical protein, conserved [Leishmania tarentolae]|uniref:Uncharacterized protein n=1 Tax=Leishmania tarentolae TaxID=5689 RepID=A0A640KIX6_LEITA|nr:hypothetical protein, conserved [Leishmania tarentolae]